ncbi:FmdB family zinc ribbon protein [Candidatus Oscillochloris fontis]|uniref:FmdB family zinc ribbon protein n=1 Tax=Candidatus Oscillochloris fontis TaxID=2496868 RepID=UPI00101B85E9|nr:FmdB family zinc ribbon protein [Candidatus Oscillochloris fontis]
MPTYVYACDSCGTQFEKFQSFKDEPLTVCLCGQEGKVRRVIQPAGIVFKGAGWYINDSRGSTSSTVGTEPAKTEKTEEKTSTAEPASTSEKSDSSVPATSSSDE